jgi:hypothetical protein
VNVLAESLKYCPVVLGVPDLAERISKGPAKYALFATPRPPKLMIEPVLTELESVTLFTVRTPAAEIVSAVELPIVVIPDTVAKLVPVPTYNDLATPRPPKLIIEPVLTEDESVTLFTVRTPAAEIVAAVLLPIVVIPDTVAKLVPVPTNNDLATPRPPKLIIEPVLTEDESVTLFTVRTPAAEIVAAVLLPIVVIPDTVAKLVPVPTNNDLANAPPPADVKVPPFVALTASVVLLIPIPPASNNIPVVLLVLAVVPDIVKIPLLFNVANDV